MTRKMYSRSNGNFYGNMGEVIPSNLIPHLGFDGWTNGNLHVGDVVSSIKEESDIGATTGVIVKSKEGKYFIMGWWGTSLFRFKSIRRAIPHELVTDEILEHLHNMKIVEPKRMTMQEVEKELGYPFVIIRGDE